MLPGASDIRPALSTGDLLADEFSLEERKTGKLLVLRVNSTLHHLAADYRKKMGNPAIDAYIFSAGKGTPITRQAVDKMLKTVKVKYHVLSAKVFSSHTLRKTFGQRIWLTEFDRGRGDQALLLCDVLGHSNISITKRYLGIRQDDSCLSMIR